MDDTAWLEVRRVMAYLRHEEFIGGSLPNSPRALTNLRPLPIGLKPLAGTSIATAASVRPISLAC